MISSLQRLLKQYLPNKYPNREGWGWIVLPVVVAFCLLAFDRFAVQHRFIEYFAADLSQNGMAANDIQFYAQIWLSGLCLVLMVLVPVLYILAFPTKSGWGLTHRLKFNDYAIYLILAAIMLPIIWIAAGLPSFQHIYPFYKPETLSQWIIFELIYLTQFFCVEFFFRGPLLLRLNARFGLAAIGMMVVPYALLHIYKPFPEALGSIIAGFVLGYLAIKLRSIWPGVLLHCLVALSMDSFALLRSGRLATLF